MPRRRTRCGKPSLAGALGFGLVEVLVALVVVAAGMLGVAALLGRALGAERTALERTVAVALAADMAERIRANRRGGPAHAGAPAGRHCGSLAGENVRCTPAEMAAYEHRSWVRQAETQLPNGAAEVRAATDSPPTYTIVVSWDDTLAGRLSHAIAIRVADR